MYGDFDGIGRQWFCVVSWLSLLYRLCCVSCYEFVAVNTLRTVGLKCINPVDPASGVASRIASISEGLIANISMTSALDFRVSRMSLAILGNSQGA